MFTTDLDFLSSKTIFFFCSCSEKIRASQPFFVSQFPSNIVRLKTASKPLCNTCWYQILQYWIDLINWSEQYDYTVVIIFVSDKSKSWLIKQSDRKKLIVARTNFCLSAFMHNKTVKSFAAKNDLCHILKCKVHRIL